MFVVRHVALYLLTPVVSHVVSPAVLHAMVYFMLRMHIASHVVSHVVLENEGLWENNQSLGQRGIGEGNVTVSGFLPGDMVYYRVRAKGPTYGDWFGQSGQVRMVSEPSVSVLPAYQVTLTTATLRGRVVINGGASQPVLWSPPNVSKVLFAHCVFADGSGQDAYDPTGFRPSA